MDGLEELRQGTNSQPVRIRPVCQAEELPHQRLSQISEMMEMMKMGDSAARDGHNGKHSSNCITLVPAHVVNFPPLSPGEIHPDATLRESDQLNGRACLASLRGHSSARWKGQDE